MTNESEKPCFDYEENILGGYLGDIDIYKDIRLDLCLSHVGTPQGKVLDFGCGAGGQLNNIKNHFPDIEAYGTDISTTAIDIARQNYGDNAEFRVSTPDHLPFDDDFFDIIISLDVLEHIPDLTPPLTEILRVLKPGGKFHFAVECEGQPLTMMWFFRTIGFGHKFTYKYTGHVQPFLTHRKMAEIARGIGFEVTQTNYTQHLPTHFQSFALRYWPLELFRIMFGNNATDKCREAQIHKQDTKGSQGILRTLRSMWCLLGNITQPYNYYVDYKLLKNTPLTAQTLHMTCMKT